MNTAELAVPAVNHIAGSSNNILATNNSPIINTVENSHNHEIARNISLADKGIVNPRSDNLSLSLEPENPKNEFKNKINKLLRFVDKYANYSAIFANVVNFFLQTLDLSDKTRTKITNTVDFITNLSFIPYGADGMRKGINKFNPFQAFGFFMEMFSVWFSDIKTKYLIRGLGIH